MRWWRFFALLRASRRPERDLDLENDLLLSSKDVEFMRKASSQNVQPLESYLDFLEDIDAFGSKKVKTEFYDVEFEL